MPFEEAVPFAAFTEIGSTVGRPNHAASRPIYGSVKQAVVRSSVTPWRDEGKPQACLRQSKMDKPLFRQGDVKLLRCIYIEAALSPVPAAASLIDSYGIERLFHRVHFLACRAVQVSGSLSAGGAQLAEG